MQLTNSSEDGEPTAKKSREDIPDVSFSVCVCVLIVTAFLGRLPKVDLII